MLSTAERYTKRDKIIIVIVKAYAAKILRCLELISCSEDKDAHL